MRRRKSSRTRSYRSNPMISSNVTFFIKTTTSTEGEVEKDVEPTPSCSWRTIQLCQKNDLAVQPIQTLAETASVGFFSAGKRLKPFGYFIEPFFTRSLGKSR